MPTPAFRAALPFVLRWEGGFVHHPDDPGGATNQGVTQRVYDAWRAGEGLGQRSVRLIDDDEVRAIYETGYWLHEGGYYPTSRGYDVNAEIEFYDDAFNTACYLNHGARDAGELKQAFLDQ